MRGSTSWMDTLDRELVALDGTGRLRELDEENPAAESLLAGDSSEGGATVRLTTVQLLGLSCFWWGMAVWLYLFLVIIIPLQVEQLVGEANKGKGVGLVFFFGALASLFGSPYWGALSDQGMYALGRYGKRRPFLVVGSLLSFILVFFLYISNSIAIFTVFFFLLQLVLQMAVSPFNGLVADIVPAVQRGTCSGILGAMVAIGNVTGATIGLGFTSFGLGGAYAVSCAVLALATAITCLCVKEEPLPRASEGAVPPRRQSLCEMMRRFREPFRDADFFWVFFTRFLVVMGILTVQEYLLYYLREAVQLPPHLVPETAVNLMFMPLLVSALLSSFVAGWLSDKLRLRKSLVYFGGALMICVVTVMAFAPPWTLLLGLAALFGIGYGAFNAVDFAIALDVLPNQKEAAKDLGVLSLALVLPQSLAAPVGGVLLDVFNAVHPKLGYKVIFLVAGCYVLTGVMFLRRIVRIK